jgi:hypothetical protein
MNDNRNKNANSSDASNENAMMQNVTVNLAGQADGCHGPVDMSNREDCFGMCHSCKTSNPQYCPIAKKHLPAEDIYF